MVKETDQNWQTLWYVQEKCVCTDHGNYREEIHSYELQKFTLWQKKREQGYWKISRDITRLLTLISEVTVNMVRNKGNQRKCNPSYKYKMETEFVQEREKGGGSIRKKEKRMKRRIFHEKIRRHVQDEGNMKRSALQGNGSAVSLHSQEKYKEREAKQQDGQKEVERGWRYKRGK